MVERTRVNRGFGMIQEPNVTVVGENISEIARAFNGLVDTVRAVVRKINGAVSFGTGAASSQSGNIDGQTVSVFFAAANTEVEVPHGLKRTPIGYLVIGKDRAADVYDSNRGSWTEGRLLLKSSVASATVLLVLV